MQLEIEILILVRNATEVFRGSIYDGAKIDFSHAQH
jgi:hypothetical protein